MSLCLLCWLVCHNEPCWTHLFEGAKLCYDLLESLFMLHFNFLEPWNCSSASLISFWAWQCCYFEEICYHASLRLFWELVEILKKSSLGSLILSWELQILKELVLSFFTYICLRACYLQWQFALNEISPKVIDIQGRYNKNFHEDHWMLNLILCNSFVIWR